MKKTETYQLNQWELSDRVRMEDFNADNLRLEKILAKKPGRFQEIASYSAGDGNNNYGLATQVDDWSQWEIVMAVYDLSKTTFLEDDGIALAPNYTDHTFGDHIEGLGGGTFLLLLFPFHDQTSSIKGIAIGKGSTAFFSSRPFSDLTGISVRLINKTLHSYLDLSTTRFTDPVWSVYGVK